MKLLWPAWPKLSGEFCRAPCKLLFLDFDGTLAPIARVPRAVTLGADVRRLLAQLARRKDYRLCLISGRSLQDLKKFVRGSNWIYVANHGFDMEGGRLPVPGALGRVARKSIPLIGALARRLRTDLGGVPGVLVEDKGVTLSLHFRNVPRGLMSLVGKAVSSEKRRAVNRSLVWRRGKMVWEARPRMAWDKGRAALFVRRRLRVSAIVAIGDDRTDEDMFRALKGKALTIRIGRSLRTEAGYYVRSQQEVARILKGLCDGCPAV